MILHPTEYAPNLDGPNRIFILLGKRPIEHVECPDSNCDQCCRASEGDNSECPTHRECIKLDVESVLGLISAIADIGGCPGLVVPHINAMVTTVAHRWSIQEKDNAICPIF